MSGVNRSWRRLNSILEKYKVITALLFTVSGGMAGAILDAAVRNYLDTKDVEAKTISIVLGALAATILVLLWIIHLINDYKSQVEKSTKHRLEHWGERATLSAGVANSNVRGRAYDFCSDRAYEASESIYIFGPLFTDQFIDPRGGDKSAHDRYLEEGIEAAVNRHFALSHSRFTYYRVAQVSEGFDKAIDARGYIRAGALENEALANHVKRVLARDRVQSLKIEINVRSPVPTFPSTMVIDSRWVFFSLPTRIPVGDGDDSGEFLAYQFVVGIEDTTGVIPNLFKRIIEDFGRHSTRILGVS